MNGLVYGLFTLVVARATGGADVSPLRTTSPLVLHGDRFEEIPKNAKEFLGARRFRKKRHPT